MTIIGIYKKEVGIDVKDDELKGAGNGPQIFKEFNYKLWNPDKKPKAQSSSLNLLAFILNSSFFWRENSFIA